MEGRQSSEKDSSKTHEPISVDETKLVETSEYRVKKSKTPHKFSCHKEIEAIKQLTRHDSSQKYDSMEHQGSLFSCSSPLPTTKVSTKASIYDDEPLNFRINRSSRHRYRLHEDVLTSNTRKAHMEEKFDYMDADLVAQKEDFDYRARVHSSSNRIPIKLSAKQIIESNERGSGQIYNYLTDRFSEECSKSLTPKSYFASNPIYLDLFVDLSELECEKPSPENIQRIPSSRYYFYHDNDIYILENYCQVSLVVTQTAQESVSTWAIMQVEQTFKDLNLLYNEKNGRTKRVLKSVDISRCTVLTQVLLLPEIFSSCHQHTERFNRFLQKYFSLKIICFFSKDLEHLKEDELAQIIEMSKPLVINGDISKDQLQSLIQCICVTYQKLGQMPLALAASNESLTLTLIEAGADVNQTNEEGKTALFYAGNNEKVTHALIKAGADVNITDKHGKTALFYAGKREVIHALTEAGVDVNMIDKDGKTALFYASDNEKVIHALTEAGADVNKTDKDGKTALFYALNNEKVTHALIEAGADVNITDKDGKTALFYAGKKQVIHELVNAGADVNITNQYGNNPLRLLRYDEKIICTLMETSTDVNLSDMDGKTPLIHAILNMNDEKLSCALIEAGADVNVTDKNNNTALFYAGNNEKVTHALIEAGANVNQTDKDGKTALFYAGDNEKVTHALIEAGANVNKTDKHVKTPLFYAGKGEVIHALTEAGADVNITDKDGKTALFRAFDNLEVFHALTKAGADVNITDKDGKPLLFYAGNNEKVTHALIKARVDVNITDKDGKTALFYAVYNTGVMKVLIEAGVDVNITDKDGKTALFHAFDNLEVFHALIKASADVNITDNDGKTAFFYAFDELEVFHALIKAGADVNITDKDGKTALFYPFDELEVFHALIEAGADVNKTDKDGKTALFYALNNEKVTHALIKAGADVNITDKDGKTALFYAVYNIGATQALIEAGAEVNITDKDGKTAFLHIFDTDISNIHRYNSSKQICKCLLENGSSLCETSKEEETAFHLIFKLFQQAIISTVGKFEKQLILQELMSILELFSGLRKSKVAVNKRNIHLNSPLHLWASLGLTSSRHYSTSIFDNHRFEDVLKHILNLLVKCGVKLNDSNEKGETPLHVCRTCTAVKLLLDAGANPTVTDSSGRTPLLAAAMSNTCLEKGSNNFYPDVTEDPKEFWEDVLHKKLDPWTADKKGESVLSIILKNNCYQLASSLVEVACERNYTTSDEAGVSLLAAICKDKPPDIRMDKIVLVKKLLSSRRTFAQGRLINQDTPLHFSCRNMLELPEEEVKTSLHWEIARYLLLCGADVETPGVDGKSCLELAEKCPVLKDLLSIPVSSKEVLINTWKPTTLKHNEQLAKVARGYRCQQIKSFYYFNEPLDNGCSFGLVFVGINTQDGKEIAVKRVEIMRIDQEKVRNEIKDLKATIDCDKVIQCLLCTEDKDFLYVVLELMEGNLVDLLSDEHTFDYHQKIELCRDIITGLEYLHRIDITHCDIKPSNILYQVLPQAIKLKLAFFGLRCQMSEQCTSDFTDTYEALTKASCWMAPEVLQSQSHSQSSDIFSCGLVIHYLLSDKKHPFAPLGSSEETSLAVSIETVGNIAHDEKELDEAISSDAKELLEKMLNQDTSCRPKILEVLAHRCFQATSE